MQAVYKHIDRLIFENQITKKSGRFVLQSTQYRYLYRNDGTLSEDAILELFKQVILDFKDVEYIGQALADEIFRVFPNMNPHTLITAQNANANANVQSMINRAINTKL